MQHPHLPQSRFEDGSAPPAIGTVDELIASFSFPAEWVIVGLSEPSIFSPAIAAASKRSVFISRIARALHLGRLKIRLARSKNRVTTQYRHHAISSNPGLIHRYLHRNTRNEMSHKSAGRFSRHHGSDGVTCVGYYD